VGALRERVHPVLWLGGTSGIGKTTAARSLARRLDLRLYSLDARTYEHAQQLPPETRSLDELWVDTTAHALADWFEQSARERFHLVVSDLLSLPDDAPVIADGPQLLPSLVTPLLDSPRFALFVVARGDVQRRLVTERGSDLYARTRDPERALENRLQRDALLAHRVQAAATACGLEVVAVSDVTGTGTAVEARCTPLLREWTTRRDRGDVAARRRDENDVRLRQLRAHAAAAGISLARKIEFACECNRPGCALTVAATLDEAEAARCESRPLVAEAHS